MDDPADDPGRFWRRTARCGALIATVIAFYPLNLGDTLANFVLSDITSLISNDESAMYHRAGPWVYFFIWTGSASVILCGPLMLLFCSVISTLVGIRRAFHMLMLFGVFLLNGLVPVCVVLRLLPPESDVARGIGVGATLIFLMLHGTIALVTMQKKRQPDLPFWCGLIVLVMNLLTWICMVTYGLLFAVGYSTGDWILFFAALAGAVPLLLGWVMWWRAVKLAQPTAESAIQNPQSEIVNPTSSC